MLDKLLGESIEKNMFFEKLFGLLSYPKALSPQHFIIVCFALKFWHINPIEWVRSTKAKWSKETEAKSSTSTIFHSHQWLQMFILAPPDSLPPAALMCYFNNWGKTLVEDKTGPVLNGELTFFLKDFCKTLVFIKVFILGGNEFLFIL